MYVVSSSCLSPGITAAATFRRSGPPPLHRHRSARSLLLLLLQVGASRCAAHEAGVVRRGAPFLDRGSSPRSRGEDPRARKMPRRASVRWEDIAAAAAAAAATAGAAATAATGDEGEAVEEKVAPSLPVESFVIKREDEEMPRSEMWLPVKVEREDRDGDGLAGGSARCGLSPVWDCGIEIRRHGAAGRARRPPSADRFQLEGVNVRIKEEVEEDEEEEDYVGEDGRENNRNVTEEGPCVDARECRVKREKPWVERRRHLRVVDLQKLINSGGDGGDRSDRGDGGDGGDGRSVSPRGGDRDASSGVAEIEVVLEDDRDGRGHGG
ncbi:uncharacterized protein LOC116957640 [Petromyzon marinus]|uniref:uncharacterized protein LOC116957640 n=1 Tax=Petromyzon marinus TaxID=7757 RepID=UPI003F72CB92